VTEIVLDRTGEYIPAPPEFKAFDSIPRLMRDVIVTEKIDGTNAQILITEDGRIFAGSRNRWITPEDDNFGFAKWVAQHDQELRAGLGIGTHYGEWWGSGIQRGYGLIGGEKRFSLFNTSRWAKQEPPPCVSVVPVLGIRVFDTHWIHETLEELQAYGSYAAPGFVYPEGIVVFHPKSKTIFKYTLDGDGHKGAK
jgi:hypothetical protein